MKDEKLEKLLKTLKECRSGNLEGDHQEADYALLEYIDNPEVTKAFEEIPKWYA